MKNHNVEVLAPAGSYDIMKAVINAGADAVYLGGDMFVPPFIIQLLFFIHMYIIINVCVYNNHQNSVFGGYRTFFIVL